MSSLITDPDEAELERRRTDIVYRLLSNRLRTAKDRDRSFAPVLTEALNEVARLRNENDERQRDIRQLEEALAKLGYALEDIE